MSVAERLIYPPLVVAAQKKKSAAVIVSSLENGANLDLTGVCSTKVAEEVIKYLRYLAFDWGVELPANAMKAIQPEMTKGQFAWQLLRGF